MTPPNYPLLHYSPTRRTTSPTTAARPVTPNAEKAPDDAPGRPPFVPDSIAPAASVLGDGVGAAAADPPLFVEDELPVDVLGAIFRLSSGDGVDSSRLVKDDVESQPPHST